MNEKREFILNIFQNRYTCKGYNPEKIISNEDFMTIMEVARLSPSSMGLEPWKFILLNNKKIKEKIKPYSWGAEEALDNASHFVIILARSSEDMRFDSEYFKYITKEIQNHSDDMVIKRIKKYKDFQENDFKLLESKRAMFDWACKQTYIPLANMLTTAAILGIDSTPMEGFHQKKVEEILVAEGVFDSKHFGVAAMIAFGYKNRDHKKKTRRKMDEVFEIIE